MSWRGRPPGKQPLTPAEVLTGIQDPDPPFITAKKLMAELGICKRTLQNWERDGLLVPRKVGERKIYMYREISRDLVR